MKAFRRGQGAGGLDGGAKSGFGPDFYFRPSMELAHLMVAKTPPPLFSPGWRGPPTHQPPPATPTEPLDAKDQTNGPPWGSILRLCPSMATY